MKGERLGEFEELVMLCVRQLGDAAHAAASRERLATNAGGEAPLGAVYTAVGRARGEGFVRSWLGEPTPVRGGRAKRHYALTGSGEAALNEARAARDRLWKVEEA